MTKLLSALILSLASWAPLVAQAADIGVSIGISQPGVYGRIDIGRYPPPVLIQQQPIYVQSARYASPEPVYLWAPHGHRKHWRKHCHRYGACGSPVYFVRDDWYERQVMQPHRGHHHRGEWRRGDDRHEHRGRGRHHDRDD